MRRLIGEHITVNCTWRPMSLTRGPQPAGTGRDEPAGQRRDAMPGGGSVTIEAANVDLEDSRPPGGDQGAYVGSPSPDTGTGMSADTQRHLFEPFFTTKETGKGTGLAVDDMRHMKQSKGYIWVESELGADDVQGACRVRTAPRPARPRFGGRRAARAGIGDRAASSKTRPACGALETSSTVPAIALEAANGDDMSNLRDPKTRSTWW